MRNYDSKLFCLILILVFVLGGVFTGCSSDTAPNAKGTGTMSSMTVTSAAAVSSTTVTTANQVGKSVHVDQVGYLPKYPKIAVVATDKSSAEFQVININTNETVFKGQLSKESKDKSSGDTVCFADFSSVEAEGTYILSVTGIGSSFPFRINKNIYRESLINIMRSYTLTRSNTDMNDPVTGLNYPAGHVTDKSARIFFSDEFHKAGDKIDVSGGWYDAGDYGKYISTAGVAIASMMLSYESQPEKFTKGQLIFPENIANKESSSKLPDILAEVKFELDWMLKMQRPDGAVYHKVSGTRWPGMTTRPDKDNQDRYIYGMSTYSTAIYAGSMAMAYRSFVKYDVVYAKKLLDSAKKAFEFLRKNPKFIYRNDKDQDAGSGAYSKDHDGEDRFWAAAELFKTTDNKEYEDYLKNNLSNYFTAVTKFISWENTTALGQWAYITAKNADSTARDKVKAVFLKYADDIAAAIDSDGYRNSLKDNEYSWASAKNAISKGNILLMANQISPKEEYIKGALDQIHYILGRNTNGYSYLTCSGTRSVQNPHSRIKGGTGILIPGLLVGGPNNQPGGDPLQQKMIQDTSIPPAKVYIDSTDSFSTNEYAIDYAAPVIYAMAYFTYNKEDEKTGGKAGTANAAAANKGSADINYIEKFMKSKPFTDGTSKIVTTYENGTMKMEYELFKYGWVGVPSGINEDWSGFDGIQFTMKGGTGNKVRIEVIDRYNTHYEFVLYDDSQDGKIVKIKFEELAKRQDYQPDDANLSKPLTLDNVTGVNISPTEGKGTIYFSDLKLFK